MENNDRKERIYAMALDLTNRIAKYMRDNHISAARVAKDTEIPVSKLQFGTSLKLDSEEFLVLCRYLQLRPEVIESLE